MGYTRPNLQEAQRSCKPRSFIHAVWTQGQAWPLQLMQASSVSRGKSGKKPENTLSSLNMHFRLYELDFRGANLSSLALKEGPLPLTWYLVAYGEGR